MEKLNQDKNKIVREIRRNEDAEYQISKIRGFFIELTFRLTYLFIGVFLACLLYFKCMFNPACNPIVAAFFSILALSCFQAAGFPIDKLVKIKFV